MAVVTNVNKETTVVLKSVTLVLSGDEALALRAVLGKVGGDKQTSRRKYTQAIYDALNQAGVPWDQTGMSGYGIHFVENGLQG